MWGKCFYENSGIYEILTPDNFQFKLDTVEEQDCQIIEEEKCESKYETQYEKKCETVYDNKVMIHWSTSVNWY